jgi:hypothetical protein
VAVAKAAAIGNWQRWKFERKGNAMRYVGLLMCLLVAPAGKQPEATAPESPFKEVDITKEFRGPKLKVFRVKDGEATVNGSQIKRVEVGKEKVVITYFNKTKEPIQPDYSFRVFDAYGIQLGTFTDSWFLQSIPPGELHSEAPRYLYAGGLDETLKYSGVVLPADWDVPAYVVIEGDGL